MEKEKNEKTQKEKKTKQEVILGWFVSLQIHFIACLHTCPLLSSQFIFVLNIQPHYVSK